MNTDLRNDYDLPKELKLKSAREDVQQMALSCIAGGNKEHVHTTALENQFLMKLNTPLNPRWVAASAQDD